MAAGSFEFLHAADLHLDSPMVGLKRYPGAPHEELGLATGGRAGRGATAAEMAGAR